MVRRDRGSKGTTKRPAAGSEVFELLGLVAALQTSAITLEPPDPGELRRGGPAAWPAAVSAVVGKLLAKAAEERYQSGLGLAYDLERCLAELDGDGADA